MLTSLQLEHSPSTTLLHTENLNEGYGRHDALLDIGHCAREHEAATAIRQRLVTSIS